MHTKSRISIAVLSMLLAGPAAANIDIVFDYSYDTSNYFSGNATRMSLLESAASVFESRLTDNLGAITSTDDNVFKPQFFDPSSANAATPVVLDHVDIAANVIRIYVGAANLGTGTLGTLGVGGSGGSGYSTSGSTSGQTAFLNSISRGQSGYTPFENSDTDTDFAPWGGSISFNSSFGSWYFDNDLATTENFGSNYDFYSVAIHEIAHVLGYGTADSWTQHIVSCPTGNCIIGKPLADTAHWASGALSTINGLSFEVAMDPSLLNNTRKNFTDQDWNGLSKIGWQVAAVPEPETWAMLLAGLGLVGFAAGRKEKRRQG